MDLHCSRNAPSMYGSLCGMSMQHALSAGRPRNSQQLPRPLRTSQAQGPSPASGKCFPSIMHSILTGRGYPALLRPYSVRYMGLQTTDKCLRAYPY